MFLSIIIPIWNDEKFLAECLDSCLHQNIPYDDYEIICVDDGSTDRTPEILADYAKRHPNIVVINKEHGGEGGRSVGFKVAKGEYIWFVDHDDIIEENVLFSLKQEVKSTNKDRIAFSCYEFNDELSPKEKKQKAEKTLLPNADSLLDSVVWTSIVSRKFMLEKNVWPRSKRLGNKKAWGVDTLFIYELLQNDITESKLIGTPYYFYRRHTGTETSIQSAKKTNNVFFGSANMAALIQKDYQHEKNKNAEHCSRAADFMMILMRRCTKIIAESPAKEYREKKKYLKDNGLFPTKVPKESTYQRDYFWNEQNGKSRMYNLLRFYSTTEIGLFLLSVPHRMQRLKIKLSRAMRKNMLLNKILDIKNKLRGR